MTNRERLNAVLHSGRADRLPMMEWASWWDLTVERWKEEGLPAFKDSSEQFRYFGLDDHKQFWMPVMTNNCPAPRSHGRGIIENETDYNRIKPALYPSDVIKVQKEQLSLLKPLHERGDFSLWISLSGFFWFPRELFGIENHLFSFYDYPELYHRICSDLADYHILCIEQFSDIMVPDFMTFAEDMSYNHGSMISQEVFNEFLMPYYKKVIPYLKQRGTTVMVDSDGDVSKMIPWLIEADIEGILPLERQAGVDINRLRDQFPEFIFIGGFDKMVMKQGEAAMRAEFERIFPAMKKGGYIPSVDHQTPPDVSLANYKMYCRLLEEYCINAAERGN